MSPWKTRKAPNRNLYWVVNKETGKKHSKEPIALENAQAQMRALYASMRGGIKMFKQGTDYILAEDDGRVIHTSKVAKEVEDLFNILHAGIKKMSTQPPAGLIKPIARDAPTAGKKRKGEGMRGGIRMFKQGQEYVLQNDDGKTVAKSKDKSEIELLFNVLYSGVRKIASKPISEESMLGVRQAINQALPKASLGSESSGQGNHCKKCGGIKILK